MSYRSPFSLFAIAVGVDETLEEMISRVGETSLIGSVTDKAGLVKIVKKANPGLQHVQDKQIEEIIHSFTFLNHISLKDGAIPLASFGMIFFFPFFLSSFAQKYSTFQHKHSY